MAVAVAAVLTLVGTAVAVGIERAGPRADGSAVTPVGFLVSPAGRQSDLGDLPLDAVRSPDGRWLVISNDGQATQSLQVVDTASGAVAQTVPYPKPQALFTGLAFAPDGRTLYASGGGNNLIRRYTMTAGRLTEGPPLPLPTTNPAGAKLNPFPAGLAVTPDRARVLVADQQADAFSVVDVATGMVHTAPAGHRPDGVAVSPDGRTAWVSDQGANTVSVFDLTGPDPAPRPAIGVGTHPNKMLLSSDGRSLYVACGDSDEVSVIDTGRAATTATISLAPYPGAPVGSNPDALALSPDQHTLYVANAGNNDVAVADPATGRVRGLIPTGWYPTAVIAGDRALYVTNAKGLGAGPNDGPGRPNPYTTTQAPNQYVGSMMVGTLSTVKVPAAPGQLQSWSAQVARHDGFDTHGDIRSHQPAGGPVPRNLQERSPIQHVIYVVKENRTYDQEFGSLGKGNGDPALNLFGEESAPNNRALERGFVTLDNFYADAEVSAQGWNWTVAANSNPYAEQTWASNYSNRGAPYPSENGDPAIAGDRDPAQAHTWDRLAAAGIPFRNYGFYLGETPGTASRADDPVLDANTDHDYRGFNLACPDTAATFTPRDPGCGPARVDEWKREFAGYLARADLPTVEQVRFPNDHTAATKPGSPTPRAYVADNDWALGQLVDTVSHSPYWASTAIFVTEDDAQNGPDHIDAHRTVAEVISPYTHTGRVDSTFYSTASMLRTMELIVGLRPLTQFDAYATPMLAAFTNHPDPTPYTARRPSQNLQETNPVTAPMAMQSSAQNFQSEDKIDMAAVNQATWASINGPGTPMPPPQHQVFGTPTAPAVATAPGPAPAPDADSDGH